MSKNELNAKNLKNELWETLIDIRNDRVDPKTANAIAAQARSIISTINVEIVIQNAVDNLSENLKNFTN